MRIDISLFVGLSHLICPVRECEVNDVGMLPSLHSALSPNTIRLQGSVSIGGIDGTRCVAVASLA